MIHVWIGDPFWLPRVPIAQGHCVPFHLWMYYHALTLLPKGNA